MALTVTAAASALGVSKSTMFTLLREGKIRSVKLGPQIRRIPRSEIEAYLAKLLEEQADEQAPGAANDGRLTA